MTFIVVPHGGGDLSTRSFEISYRRLRVAALLLLAAGLLWLGTVASWGYLAAQAARVPGLQREVAELQKDRVRVEQLARTLARMEQRYQQLQVMLGAEAVPPLPAAEGEEEGGQDAEPEPAGPAEASVPGSWPLEVRGYVTREHLARVRGRHPGIDIAVREGSRVRAAGAGVVAEVGEDSIYGKFVRVRHRDGYETMYGHLSRLLVAEGVPVAQDQVIALSGNTGVSTAPHLHFEVRRDGEPVDPRTLIEVPR